MTRSNAWPDPKVRPAMQELLEESRQLRLELVAARIKCHLAREEARKRRMRSVMLRFALQSKAR